MREVIDSENGNEAKPNQDSVEKLVKAKALVQSTLGQIILAMATVPRYRHHTLADISHLVVEPLSRDRIAIAHVNPSKADGGASELAPPAIAVWASVSEEVNEKIAEQVKAGVFPVRLKANEWNCGNIVWLLDVIAPNRDMATAVLGSFNKVAKTEEIHVHPIVSRLVDPKALKMLVTTTDTEQDAATKSGEALN